MSDEKKNSNHAHAPSLIAGQYRVVNVTRARHTRAKRIAARARCRHTQFVLDLQRRLLPARPLVISGEDLLRNLEDLKQLENEGVLEVRTMDSRKVNLATLDPAPPLPTPPLRTPPDNDAANDPPPGHFFRAPGQPSEEEGQVVPQGTWTAPESKEQEGEAPVPAASSDDEVSEEELAAAFGGAFGAEEEQADASEEEEEQVEVQVKAAAPAAETKPRGRRKRR